MYLNGGIRRIRASQKNLALLEKARTFLGSLGIQSRIDHRASAVEVTGRDNLLNFQQHVNFSAGLRINGHRKNGLHHSSLEKRELLRRALSSYTSAL